MKINFRKITSVIASAIMLGSTAGIALAASAYPAPFVVGGAADAAIVVGSNVAVSDMDAAISIQNNLNPLVTTTGTTTLSTTGGESMQIKGSTMLNIGQNLTNVKSTVISKDDLPTLLAKKTYQSKNGVSYDYDQEIALAGGLTYGLFADIDFNGKMPTLGIMKASNSPVMNYTARFVKTVESTVSSSGRLTDIENTDITLLGKTYKLLNAYNGTSWTTNGYLELMGGAVSDTMSMGDSKEYTIGDKKYTVQVIYVGQSGSTNEAKLIVNGETTNKMNIGGTQKLTDGTQLGVRDINYQNFAGGVMSVEFSLGAEKLTIQNGVKLKMNDDNVNDVVTYMGTSTSSAKATLSSITFAWISNDKTFIASDKEAVFPGLKAVKLSMSNMTVPKTEIIQVTNSGDKTIQLKLPIKSGTATIPILSLNSSASGISIIGGDSTGTNLVTGINSVFFNRTTDQYFVATYNSTTSAESYLLKVTSVSRDSPSTGINSTTIQDAITGSDVCKDKKVSDTCTFGNVVLTFTKVDPESNGVVNLTASTGINFNTIYTPSGFKVNLPVNSAIVPTLNGVNLTAQPTTYNLLMEEADKNSNLGNGLDINATLSIASSKFEVGTLTNTGFSGGNYFDLGGSSTTSKYVAYIASTLGTKLTYDTKPDQNTLEIEYHGGEVYGNVFVSAPGTSIGTGSTTKTVLIVKDTEIDTVKDKHLVVVGGSCINSVAAAVLGLTYPTCGQAFTTATNVDAGKYLIKAVTSPYNSAKTAVLVAGYEAAETNLAASKLIEGADSTVGSSIIYPQTTA